MSIAIATMGRLIPQSRVIREQFSKVSVAISDAVEVSIELEEVEAISVTVSSEDIVATVQLVDSATGVVLEVDEISGSTEGCS